MEALGRLYILDYYDCDPELLDDPGRVEALLREAAQVMGATIKSSRADRFEPHGVSATVTIGESHIAAHTWPEYRFVMVDVSTCGNTLRPWDGHAFLKQRLGSQRESTMELKRGFFPGPPGSRPHKPA